MTRSTDEEDTAPILERVFACRRDICRALEAYAPGERLGLVFSCWIFSPAPGGGQRLVPGDIGRLVDVLRRFKAEQAAGLA